MWLDFAGLIGMTVLIAYIPGYLVGRGFGLTRITSLSVAVPIEFALILILGIGLQLAHIPLSIPVFAGLIVGVSLLFWLTMILLRNRHAKKTLGGEAGGMAELDSANEPLSSSENLEGVKRQKTSGLRARTSFTIPRGITESNQRSAKKTPTANAVQGSSDRVLVLDPELSPPSLYNEWVLSQDDRDDLLGAGEGFGSSLRTRTDSQKRFSAKAHSFLSKTPVGVVDAKRNYALLALYLVTGALMATFVFLMGIDTPESFGHFDDNTSHYNFIRSFLETGYYSILQVNGFIGYEGYEGTFYPALWHIFTALVSGLTNSPILMAFNASIFVFTAVILPVGSFALFATLFPRRLDIQAMGALTCVAFAAFPWGFLIFGQLVSNLAAFSMIPAVVALFILTIRTPMSASRRCALAALLVMGFMALAGAQPNAVFTAGLICAFWLMSYLMYAIDVRSNVKNVFAFQIIAFILLVALVCALWLVFYNAPFMQSVLRSNWAAYGDVLYALKCALALMPGDREHPQFVLGLVVIIGFIGCLRKKGYRWMAFLYLLGLIFYVVDMGTEGPIKSLLVGFWYTDPYRVGAMFALFCAPLAAVGLANIVRFIARLLGKLIGRKDSSDLAFADEGSGRHVDLSRIQLTQAKKRIRTRWLTYILSAVVVIGLVGFSLVHPFYYTLPNGKSYYSGLEKVQRYLDNSYSWSKKMYGMSGDQRDFVHRVMEVVPEDELILNVPYDGTGWTYGTEGLNVNTRYYRTSADIRPYKELRLHLDEIATNADVQKAVIDGDFHYVIRLNTGSDDPNRSNMYGARYNPDDWIGIEGITDETPGFEVVLADGNMRLYRILSPEELAHLQSADEAEVDDAGVVDEAKVPLEDDNASDDDSGSESLAEGAGE